MAHKLFILGLPGSGKSTIACHIFDYFKRNQKEWSAQRLCDYDLLYSMFLEDKAQKHFYPTEHKGFLVKSPFIYDKALKQLEMEIASREYDDNTLIVIEFARSDYIRAFANFNPEFFQDAYFLFLDVDIETGMKRVMDRVKHPHSRDDHFVSKYTFEFYRQKDTAKYLSGVVQHITKRYGIQPQRTKIMNNNKGPKKEFWDSIHEFVDNIMEYAFMLA
jgi:adenylate kinase family enzyme